MRPVVSWVEPDAGDPLGDQTRVLVLTNQVIPEMAGTGLAAALHEIRSDLAIILMTHHGEPLQAHRLQAVGIREVLK